MDRVSLPLAACSAVQVGLGCVLNENGYIVAYPASVQGLVFLPDGLFNARAWNMRESFGEAVHDFIDGF
jgi:hypothetical protein